MLAMPSPPSDTIPARPILVVDVDVLLRVALRCEMIECIGGFYA